jgi:hypothetical protein
MVMRVASFQTSYYLSGHSFFEQQLRHAQIGFRKIDNAFLAVDDVAALLAAADKLSADIIRKRLDYWILILGRSSPPRNVSSSTCHAFMRSPRSSIAATSPSSATSPIHKLFERSCSLGLWRLTADNLAEIFGTRVHRKMQGKLARALGYCVMMALNRGTRRARQSCRRER